MKLAEKLTALLNLTFAIASTLPELLLKRKEWTKTSRYKDINTAMTYYNNRNNHQDEMSQLLDDLV